jgi:tetratricopeptide (TPR) repeat protein
MKNLASYAGLLLFAAVAGLILSGLCGGRSLAQPPLQSDVAPTCSVDDGFDPVRCRLAIQEHRKLLTADPSRRELLETLAQELGTLGGFLSTTGGAGEDLLKEARSLYRLLIERDPKNIDARIALSQLTDDESERTQLLSSIAATQNAPIDTHLSLAKTLLQRGQREAADVEFQRFLDALLPPIERSDAMEVVDYANQLAVEGQTGSASRAFLKVIELLEEEGPVEQCFAVERMDRRRMDEMPALKLEAQRLLSHCTGLEHRNEAVRLTAQGRLDEAIVELEAEVLTNPQYAESYALLYGLYNKQGRGGDAQRMAGRFLTVPGVDATKICKFVRTAALRRIGPIDDEFGKQLGTVCARLGL